MPQHAYSACGIGGPDALQWNFAIETRVKSSGRSNRTSKCLDRLCSKKSIRTVADHSGERDSTAVRSPTRLCGYSCQNSYSSRSSHTSCTRSEKGEIPQLANFANCLIQQGKSAPHCSVKHSPINFEASGNRTNSKIVMLAKTSTGVPKWLIHQRRDGRQTARSHSFLAASSWRWVFSAGSYLAVVSPLQTSLMSGSNCPTGRRSKERSQETEYGRADAALVILKSLRWACLVPIFFHVRGAEADGRHSLRWHLAGFLPLWIKFRGFVNFPFQTVDKSIETGIFPVSILKRRAFFCPFPHSYPYKISNDLRRFSELAFGHAIGSLVRGRQRQEIRLC